MPSYTKYALLGIAALSLASCDSSSTGTKVRSENLDGIASPPSIIKSGDNITFTKLTGEDNYTDLIISSLTNGTLRTSVTLTSENAANNRLVQQVTFQYTTTGDNNFRMNYVKNVSLNEQFRNHLNIIYGGTTSASSSTSVYGYDSETRQIVLGHDGNFTNAELQSIADEFNGVIETTTGTSRNTYAPLLYVHTPTKTLYIIDHQTFNYDITSDNRLRLEGRIKGNYQITTYGKVVGWRRPTASEIGDASQWRLEPNQLIPYVTQKTVNLGTSGTGTFEMEILINNSVQ